MRSLREIRRLIGHARVASEPEGDQAVLRHLLVELATVAEDAPQLHEDETRSAADLLTVACLNAAFRRGGLEAVERQCEMAASGRALRPERISIGDLIRELDL